MARTLRFYLDENIHRMHAVANGLRRRGIDVMTVIDSKLRGPPDHVQFAFAQSVGRVIFTLHDEDYLALAANARTHAGIGFCYQGHRTIRQMIQGLELIWEVLDVKDMQNHVEFI
jgi:hypothetical protein